MPAKLEISVVPTGLEKFSFHFNPKESQCQKCSNYCTIALISNASKVMLKILQARLQQYMNCELRDVQAGFRKGRMTSYLALVIDKRTSGHSIQSQLNQIPLPLIYKSISFLITQSGVCTSISHLGKLTSSPAQKENLNPS